MTRTIRGHQALLEALQREGVAFIFGNPGSTEVQWLDILGEYPRLQFLMTLHEDVAVGMADGYALASGEPAVASVHTTPGTTHALGNLFNASVSGTPLVVLAGQQDSRLLMREPFLASDLVQLTRQYVKWGWQVARPEEIPFAVHRAFKVATDPPPGPVLLAIPRDLYDQEFTAELPTPTREPLSRRTGPDREAIRRAAELLTNAERPIILCGPGARGPGVASHLARLAETLAIPVHDDLFSPASFPPGHPSYLGPIDFRTVAASDVLLVIGQRAFVEPRYEMIPLVSGQTKIIQIDANPKEIARLYPVAVGIIGDPEMSIEALLPAVEEAMTSPQRERRERRRGELRTARAAGDRAREEEIRQHWDRTPISAQRLVGELRRALPPDGIVVVEAPTTHPYLRRLLDLPAPEKFFCEVGGSLGWGVPAAMGVKLAKPQHPVVAVVGDGSFMYYPQAMWTAARYGITVVTIVCNNRSYLSDKALLARRKGPASQRGDYRTVDLTEPSIDYVKCAEAVGAFGATVSQPRDLPAALNAALSTDRPAVLDVALDPWQHDDAFYSALQRAVGEGNSLEPRRR